VELDERHQLLARQTRDWAAQLRPYALALDRDPSVINRLLDQPAVAMAARLQIPAQYQAAPLTIGAQRYYLTSALERTVFCEAIAWADLGLMLALPGASMAGVLVALIGDREQQEWFFGRLQQRPMWTFFALTEPSGGSDAAELHTRLRLDPDRAVLTGVKRYVGNALRASYGVVFGRTGPGPLSVGAAVVDTRAPGLRIEPIDTIGVRGAQLCAITLDAVELAPQYLLGQHLPPSRRGAWGWLRTLNQLRPTVAAMAVGLAQAAHDYVLATRRILTARERDQLAELAHRIEAVRRLARAAARAVDADPAAWQLGCAAKYLAAPLATAATTQALCYFGAGARLEHPLLDKFARDSLALEFMEGTGHIQRLRLFAALHQGTLEQPLAQVPAG
jgi:alkylation response protein AidB-like acyl-CoA dehydrogenase